MLSNNYPLFLKSVRLQKQKIQKARLEDGPCHIKVKPNEKFVILQLDGGQLAFVNDMSSGGLVGRSYSKVNDEQVKFDPFSEKCVLSFHAQNA